MPTLKDFSLLLPNLEHYIKNGSFLHRDIYHQLLAYLPDLKIVKTLWHIFYLC